MPIRSANKYYMLDMNSLSLSEVILLGVPWLANIYLNNRFTIALVSIFSVVRIIYTYLVSQSTTTIIMSLFSEISSFVIKSIIFYSYRRVGVSGISISSYSAYYTSLFRQHESYYRIQFLTFLCMLRIQQFRDIFSIVFLIPKYPYISLS